MIAFGFSTSVVINKRPLVTGYYFDVETYNNIITNANKNNQTTVSTKPALFKINFDLTAYYNNVTILDSYTD